jgi:Xaa-Pro aminopeptidase
MLSDLRRVKSPAEVDRIARAARIADDALAEVAPRVSPGATEVEVRDALEAAMRRHGADDVSFATIVATGDNAALPHHHPTSRRIAAGEAVVVDFGALVDGYHSDMTRTFVVDGPGAGEMIERHGIVRAACEAGVAAVAPGVVACEVDSACRRVLAAAGLEGELTHGVGHGVGLLIHEAPWVNARSRDVLRPGDVVTVEPGAYRVGLGGARVEELLLVTDSGHLVLSNSPKEPTCPPSPPTTSRTE